jgi:hypothetical protein
MLTTGDVTGGGPTLGAATSLVLDVVLVGAGAMIVGWNGAFVGASLVAVAT